MVIEAKSEAPLIPLEFFTNRTRVVTNFVTLFFSSAFFSYFYLGHLQPRYATPGAVVSLDLDIDRFRRPFSAKVAKLPFFNPARKRQ